MVFTNHTRKTQFKIMAVRALGETWEKRVALRAQRTRELEGYWQVWIKFKIAPAHMGGTQSLCSRLLNKDEVKRLWKRRNKYILPEVEAISIDALFEAEKRGYHVIPNAEAVIDYE